MTRTTLWPRRLLFVCSAFPAVALSQIQPEVTGELIYRVRIALPQETVALVQLQDVSLADAPAKLISEVKFTTGGKQVPLQFRLPYRVSDIDPRRTYAVRATLSLNGKLLFTSTSQYPVLTHNAPSRVSIVLEQAARSNAPAPATAAASPPLEGTHWNLLQLGSRPALTARPAYILFNPEGHRIAGTGGCNRIMGTYEVKGLSLYIHPLGQTMMACPAELMDQEKRFLEALQKTTAFQIANQVLTLLDGTAAVARFEARP